MEHIKKHLYWDIYGVKTFPYRGKRKYLPCLYQDYDGTFMIRNDVLGLTIAQFEREFKELLVRRKENEALIQNVRFPTKTTIEYLEYLKYGDDTVQGCSRATVLTDEDRQVRKLVHVAGTEYDIRIRQRMFILIDNITKKSDVSSPNVTSGSLAEGIDLPGSDVDIMTIALNSNVIGDVEHLNLSTRNTMLLMKDDTRYPGFCKLKLVAEGYDQDSFVTDSLVETEDGLYLSTQKFIQICLNLVSSRHLLSRHGPCIADANQYVDHAVCFRSICWPTIASNWCNRHRKGRWPSSTVIDSVMKDGCLLVPIGPRHSESELFWRISFSLAEKRLTHSMNYTQLLCYVLLKLTLKNILNRNEDVTDLLCSYFLKTTVFWLSEEMSINTFKISNLSHCFFACIEKLVSFVRNCYCPNYFIPEHNMLIGKIDACNSKPLLNILEGLQKTQFPVILDYILGHDAINEATSNFIRTNDVSVDVELLFYRVLDACHCNCHHLKTALTTLQYVELLMKSESSEFLLGVLRYYQALINQRMRQLFILPDCRHQRYRTIQYCHKCVTDGTKTDAVSGWLLHASCLYVLGQYKKTLQIVDNVLSRCTPDMIPLGDLSYTKAAKNRYKHKTDSNMTLNHKMRHATIGRVYFIQHSTIIPQELQLQVQDSHLVLPPVVFSQCLQFLCYHHLGDVNNRDRSVWELRLTNIERYFVMNYLLPESISTLGLCFEISGDKNRAYICYIDALHCKNYGCRSAERRLENLFRT